MTKTPKAISLIITTYKMELICQCKILKDFLDDLKGRKDYVSLFYTLTDMHQFS